jgi:ribonuclease Z
VKFELTILGSAAATPAYGRFPSSQVLNIQDQWFMIDCGEGTQMRLTDFHIPRNRINFLFVSHLHGDHIFGLVGMLTSMSLVGRTQAFTIYAPEGLAEILEVTLRISQSHLTFPLHVHVIDTTEHKAIFENEILTVYTIPLKHSVPTCGFLFKEKPLLPNFIKEKISEYNIPVAQIPLIKFGADFVNEDGTIIPHSELTIPAPPPRSFAYCSDTMYFPEIVPHIEDVDILYHEATFTTEQLENAAFGMHSTATQAAQIALAAKVKMLVIGHISARYPDAEATLAEAQKTFKTTFSGLDGTTFSVPYRR